MLGRLNIHAKISLFYVAINLPLIGILFTGNFDHSIRYTMITFVCSLAVTIMVAPTLLRFSFIKQSFNWIDALTKEQKEGILSIKAIKSGKIPRASDYNSRVNPYLLKIGACSIVLSIIGQTPFMLDSHFSILCGAVSCYLVGVLLSILATLPILSSVPNS